uniref:Uncharacterized protein n=1 Tax=Oryza sativa subsp. japonica TaxID=39947 RepID=Q60F41_ORYSJ|nr:hypothetical protein [Oryza sativa Japonica Group]
MDGVCNHRQQPGRLASTQAGVIRKHAKKRCCRSPQEINPSKGDVSPPAANHKSTGKPPGTVPDSDRFDQDRVL